GARREGSRTAGGGGRGGVRARHARDGAAGGRDGRGAPGGAGGGGPGGGGGGPPGAQPARPGGTPPGRPGGAPAGGEGRARGAAVAGGRRLGGADLLVHNASALGAQPLVRLEELPLGGLRRALEVNLVAALGLAQEALPLLRAPREGALVTVSSDAAAEAY